MDWTEISKKFDAPFPLDDIEFRIGNTNADKTKGMLLAYVAARAIQRRFDEAVGKQNWMQEYHRLEAEKGNICTISIYDDSREEWIPKSDGAGDSDFEPFKGGLSDAFKRAASAGWGVGRYLYELPSWWVAVEQHGKSYHPAKGEEDRIKKGFPQWALPDGKKPDPKPELTPLQVQQARFGEKETIFLLTLARPGVAPITAAADKKVIKWLDDYATTPRRLSEVFLSAINANLTPDQASALMEKIENAGIILPPADERNYLDHLPELGKLYAEAK